MAAGSVDSKVKVLQIINENRQAIRLLGVSRLGLFGSFVRDEPTKESDVDFIVEFEQGKKTYKNFLALAEFLESLLHRNVELVTPQSLSPYIGPHIIKTVEYVALAS
jgi:hypothetical protein